MNILAIDSSGGVASVAILSEDKILGEYTTNFKKTHSQTLLPMIDALMSLLEFDKNTLDAIAISEGPGSFTGLRIGSATAKGLALALDIPMIEVSTLEGLAFNCWGSDRLICPIMDARRNQAYTGLYKIDENELSVISGPDAKGIDEIVEDLNERAEAVVFCGDGVIAFSSYINDNLKVPFLFAPADRCEQRASSIALLAAKKYKNGEMINSRDHSPEYLRLSQAERERLEQGLSIEAAKL